MDREQGNMDRFRTTYITTSIYQTRMMITMTSTTAPTTAPRISLDLMLPSSLALFTRLLDFWGWMVSKASGLLIYSH